MNPAEDWSQSLAGARAGRNDAANEVALFLLEWALRKVPHRPGLEEEDLCVSFVEHMIRDDFSRLPLSHGPLPAFLGTSWRHFLINWLARDERRRLRELPWAEWARMEEDEEDEGMDGLPGSEPGPEEVTVWREELRELKAGIARLSPAKQRIFALFFEAGLTEPEIAAQLGMNRSTVKWHVHSIRRRLQAWRSARQG